VRRVLLVGLVLLALALGVAGGYYTGDRLEAVEPTSSGDAEPLGTPPTPSTPTPSLPVKTPVPNNTPALERVTDYRTRQFTAHPEGQDPEQLSIKVPAGWGMTRSADKPQEVHFVDAQGLRGVRVEAVEPAVQTPPDALAQLIVDLKKSLPPEDALNIINQGNQQITAEDGRKRSVSTLVYTYIPGDTRRYVVVRWIATEGQYTDVEMSITGLPQDAPALDGVLATTTKSVQAVG
jgi:hypothetical protein